VKPADVRFYVDADILGLGKLLGSLRPDVTYPGDRGATIRKRDRRPCVIERANTPDPVWIPTVAAHGWLIITRDSNIWQHRAGLTAIRDHDARMVALSGKDARTTWDQLEVVMNQWRAIERLLDIPGPFIYTATRTALRAVDLT
jgi:hypothetical protein